MVTNSAISKCTVSSRFQPAPKFRPDVALSEVMILLITELVVVVEVVDVCELVVVVVVTDVTVLVVVLVIVVVEDVSVEVVVVSPSTITLAHPVLEINSPLSTTLSLFAGFKVENAVSRSLAIGSSRDCGGEILNSYRNVPDEMGTILVDINRVVEQLQFRYMSSAEVMLSVNATCSMPLKPVTTLLKSKYPSITSACSELLTIQPGSTKVTSPDPIIEGGHIQVNRFASTSA